MSYILTSEQQDIINTSVDMYNNPTDSHLLKVSAVAGLLNKTTGHKRLLLQCVCTLCGSNKVMNRERFELKKDKVHACLSCACKIAKSKGD